MAAQFIAVSWGIALRHKIRSDVLQLVEGAKAGMLVPRLHFCCPISQHTQQSLKFRLLCWRANGFLIEPLCSPPLLPSYVFETAFSGLFIHLLRGVEKHVFEFHL